MKRTYWTRRLLIPLDSSWRDQAACAGHDPRLWDDATGDGEPHASRTERHQRATAVCRTCPVARQCVDDARPGRDEGIRGGLRMPATSWPGDGSRRTA